MSASKYVFGNGCTHVAIHINRNQEELLQWSLAAKQKDEDRAALEKYDQIDNQKIKALVESCFFIPLLTVFNPGLISYSYSPQTLKMEKAAKALQDKKVELEETVTESQTVQIELDKTAEQFKELHTQV